MRLSDAIAMGRTLVHPIAGITLTFDGLNGCALGMAFKANGGNRSDWPVIESSIPFDAPLNMWPWLKEKRTKFKSPCNCGEYLMDATPGGVVAHLFDCHVMVECIGKMPSWMEVWTLDQLIDFVRSIEPEETDADSKLATEDRDLAHEACGDTLVPHDHLS